MEQSNSPVDIVVTFVDCNDPVWQNAISKYNSEFRKKRYRSWDNLQYWFRCVERNMPFIRNVHLVVSNIEQVPEWVDREKVHVVLHRDIIPEKFLPTFNSTTIEMFLWRIPGLAEKFIYSNDDMFAVNMCEEKDFFVDGLPVYQLIERTHAQNTFRNQCRKSFRVAQKASGYKTENRQYYFYIKHSFDPMLKSVCEELWEKAGDVVEYGITKFREPFNCTQYLFPDYSIMTGRCVLGTLDLGYYNFKSINMTIGGLKDEKRKVVCLNDCRCDDFEQACSRVNDAFHEMFPERSRFEK